MHKNNPLLLWMECHVYEKQRTKTSHVYISKIKFSSISIIIKQEYLYNNGMDYLDYVKNLMKKKYTILK